MKPLFYYFGVCRQGKLFSVADTISILNDGSVHAVNNTDASFIDKKLKIDSFFDIYRFERGLLFGISKNRKIENFLSNGKMLSPKIRKGNLSIFFLDKEKIILFKLNQRMESWKQSKSFVWKLTKQLNLISLKNFKKKTRDIIDDKYSSECNTNGFKFGSLSVSICNFDRLYFSIKIDNYNRLKKKISFIYKENPLPPLNPIRHK